MEIWLLRHASAEDRADSGRDADRTLTEDGHRRAREVARGLASLEPKIELILTSPYWRAREPAQEGGDRAGPLERLRRGDPARAAPPQSPGKAGLGDFPRAPEGFR